MIRFIAQHRITNLTGAKPDELQHYFSRSKCAETRLQASAITKILRVLYPGPTLKRETERDGEGSEEGEEGSGREGVLLLS